MYVFIVYMHTYFIQLYFHMYMKQKNDFPVVIDECTPLIFIS